MGGASPQLAQEPVLAGLVGAEAVRTGLLGTAGAAAQREIADSHKADAATTCSGSSPASFMREPCGAKGKRAEVIVSYDAMNYRCIDPHIWST